MRTIIHTSAFLAALSLALPAHAAGDAVAGKKKAMSCATCHGHNGMATLPEAPNLAGQNPIYVIKALKDYKSGARKNAQMTVMVGTLSDQDMADLAAYYASFKVSVEAPK